MIKFCSSISVPKTVVEELFLELFPFTRANESGNARGKKKFPGPDLRSTSNNAIVRVIYGRSCHSKLPQPHPECLSCGHAFVRPDS